MTIGDVDLKRGIIALDENKTDDPRAPTYPALVPALKVWIEIHRKDAKPTDRVFVQPSGEPVCVDRLAERYRDQLRVALAAAKVKERPELFEKRVKRRRLRVHDLRGAFVTYALANGATETWVMDRTGHRSSAMVNRYRRVARTVEEAGLGNLDPLHVVIPELAAEVEADALRTASKVAAQVAAPLPKRARRRVTRRGEVQQFRGSTEGGTRTLTTSRSADFESAASAIPPLRPVPRTDARGPAP